MLKFFSDLICNPVMVSAATGWFVAQLTKVIKDIVLGRFTVRSLVASGGMPSTHSSLVMALVVSTGIAYGGRSFEFVIAFFFAMIVMYDAMGVRLETGREAGALNALRQRDLDEGREALFTKPLNEKIGHTLPEIVSGGVLGIVCAVIISQYIPFFILH